LATGHHKGESIGARLAMYSNCVSKQEQSRSQDSMWLEFRARLDAGKTLKSWKDISLGLFYEITYH
jgi:hypothetical protein